MNIITEISALPRHHQHAIAAHIIASTRATLTEIAEAGGRNKTWLLCKRRREASKLRSTPSETEDLFHEA